MQREEPDEEPSEKTSTGVKREIPEKLEKRKVGSYHDGGEDLLDIDASSSRTLGALPSTHASHEIGEDRGQFGATCPIR